MKIGGIQKVSLIDYPGKISAVIFTRGCNFKCPYCHNPGLVFCSGNDMFPILENDVLLFLKSRIFRLQGVVISGGEPTLQPNLAEFLTKIRSLGYSIKLDTNGSRPDVIKQLIDNNLLDFIAMDIKAPIVKYGKICGVSINTDHIKSSIDIIIKSGITCQFRMTLAHPLVYMDDALAVQRLIPGHILYLQPCRIEGVLDSSKISDAQYSEQAIQILQSELNALQQKEKIPELQVSA